MGTANELAVFIAFLLLVLAVCRRFAGQSRVFWRVVMATCIAITLISALVGLCLSARHQHSEVCHPKCFLATTPKREKRSRALHIRAS
ncbi:hypothetical protein, partial [Secundilactobacillus similis]|uniref:hypothetical protein n=1 Tax=Secundilactobacillus similis TaxID=414682 RepID=UPI0031CE36CD